MNSGDVMDYEIVKASAGDKSAVLALYRAQIGREFCPWNEDYPSEYEIDFDLSRDALFVLKTDGQIKAAISFEEDEDVDSLECWSADLKPSGSIARVAVMPDEQSKGYGRIMLQYAMDELKRRGYKGIHFLVNKHNVKAIRSYAVFGFDVVGECHMFEQDFLCYEKRLN